MPNISGETETGASELLKSAAGALHTTDGTWTPLGYQQITVLTAATALTVPAGARFAHIQAQAQNVRYRDDGIDPTAAIGNRIFADDIGFVYPGNLATIRFIQETATAILNIQYYK